jgi:para-nitrobenzyl esterase
MTATARLPEGTLRGFSEGAVTRYRGVRYATAARFEPPVDAAAWGNARDALVDGAMCPQPAFTMAPLGLPDSATPHSEDCFFLTITVPNRPAEHPRPVMVWFYGGAYINGSGSSDVYDPASLVDEGDVIVVTVNYRLGAFGYLGIDLGADGAVEANLGVLDQLSGLRWVQRNIAGFGGDPGNVTIFGQSAGGDSVAYLLAVREADDLYRRAIVQSAPLGLDAGRVNVARQLAANFARELDADARTAPVADMLAAQVAATAGLRGHPLTVGMPYAPVPGVWPIPPAAELRDRWRERAAAIDVIIGFTRDDASPFLERVPILERLPRPARAALTAALTKRIFGAPALRLASLLATSGARVFTYRFDWRPVGTPWGACHCIDLPFLWGDRQFWASSPMLGDTDWDAIDAQGREIRMSWVAFARTGDPGWSPLERGGPVGRHWDFDPAYPSAAR